MKLTAFTPPLLALVIAGCGTGASPTGSAAPQSERQALGADRTLKVMSQNLYFGTELSPLLSATTLPQFLVAAQSRFEEVQRTDFPARADRIADEVTREQPDLIGLQEADVWRTDSPADGAVTPAETVAYDLVALLLEKLAQRGQHYAVVARSDNFDVEGPSALGIDVRLSDHDVLLARTDLPASELKLSNAQAGNFLASLVVSALGAPIHVVRGWTSVDVKLRGKSLRVVSTHLEFVAPPVALAQAHEVLETPASTSLPVVLIGDFNSQAPGGSGFPTAVYDLVTAAGFVDTWAVAHPGVPGFTCCQAEDLLNAVSLATARIDHVFTRGPLAVLDVHHVGDSPEDRVRSQAVPTNLLWPSDHAGVVATLALERAR